MAMAREEDIQLPAIIVEPGIGYWRSATLDEEGFPEKLTFHDDVGLSYMGAVFKARVTAIDNASDIAFFALGKSPNGAQISGMMNLRRAKQLASGPVSSISDCLQEGQRIMVQVLAEPASLERKALPLTARPRLDGHYISIEAGKGRLNLSKDLSPLTGQTLSEKLQDVAQHCAVIIRSSAEHVRSEVVVREAKTLADILAQAVDQEGLLHVPSPAQKTLLGARYVDGPIYVEGAGSFATLKALAQKECPDLVDRLQLYRGSERAFETYGVEEAIEEALAEQIMLPSGGWISIHESRALTAIDVNLGTALKGGSASEAKLVTNMEAALAIAHHLKFQDIGGLVVVDFVDMSTKGSAAKLLDLFDEAVSADTAQVRRSGISAFGLVEINRQRKGLSLRDRLLVQKDPEFRISYRASNLLNRALVLGQSAGHGDLTIATNQTVIDWLERRPIMLEDVKKQTGRAIWLILGEDEVYLK
jgi:Rne/Rng family ribonuclease